MFEIVILAVVFSTVTAISIALLGDRSLISGNLLEVKTILRLAFHWKFILSMSLAVTARMTFILINSSLLKISALAQNSTTITAFITALSYVFIILINYLFLKERLSWQQGVGSLMVVSGIWVILLK